ncbi:hypothetical protein [Pedobacter cryophilus]|uniref:DUF4177 domain-containing protein n=1 Tax=Pedobacter cryophilus TaxID=2571271 RepID=A0A4U1C1X1_9SPHI|nr:hypothetical protein [Pedobacter cryophilus]TKB97903.1 hypothetical protein FA046_11190 [Pedobacter cryophilus]
MKIIIYSLLIIFITGFNNTSFAQEASNTNEYRAFVFCELVASSSSLNTKTKVSVDFGLENPKSKERRLLDESGKIKTFNSMVDALNFMSEKGWEFVQAYVTIYDKDSTTHWLLKKKSD